MLVKFTGLDKCDKYSIKTNPKIYIFKLYGRKKVLFCSARSTFLPYHKYKIYIFDSVRWLKLSHFNARWWQILAMAAISLQKKLCHIFVVVEYLNYHTCINSTKQQKRRERNRPCKFRLGSRFRYFYDLQSIFNSSFRYILNWVEKQQNQHLLHWRICCL